MMSVGRQKHMHMGNFVVSIVPHKLQNEQKLEINAVNTNEETESDIFNVYEEDTYLPSIAYVQCASSKKAMKVKPRIQTTNNVECTKNAIGPQIYHVKTNKERIKYNRRPIGNKFNMITDIPQFKARKTNIIADTPQYKARKTIKYLKT
eukprot:218788_1